MSQELLTEVKAKAQSWLDGNYDESTKEEVRNLLANDEKELVDAFYRDLEFGTGGLRGIMGAGSNRMNIYTVGMATQGLANYLKANFSNLEQIKVVIGYDCRNNNTLFSETAAKIFAANGIKVYLFDALRPTPEISFAIRHLGCQSGVVVTASHNPKEYNGYKVYWEDGAQIVAPHDVNIVNEVANMTNVDEVKWDGNPELIEMIGKDVDDIYLAEIKKLSLFPELIIKHNDAKIVYTPIHGTGKDMVPASLKNWGFTNIINIPEQDVISGNFPTVESPNPEEKTTMKMALDKAKEVDADIVLATDPDSDRIGVAVKNTNGEFVLLNGNQTCVLLTYYLVEAWKETGQIKGNEYIVKTIVTSELMADLANKNNLEYYDTYTGFKFIASAIRENEGKKTYIGGGEESFGFLAGDFVRDKDAVSACSLFAELSTWAKEQGKSVYEILIDIYLKYDLYKESLVNLVRKGKEGADEIKAIMEGYRNNAPESINGSKVVRIKDYLSLEDKFLESGKVEKLDYEGTSNVLQFYTADGTKISVRPSGTEPKIKYYFSVKDKLNSSDEFYTKEAELDNKIESYIKALNI